MQLHFGLSGILWLGFLGLLVWFFSYSFVMPMVSTRPVLGAGCEDRESHILCEHPKEGREAARSVPKSLSEHHRRRQQHLKDELNGAPILSGVQEFLSLSSFTQSSLKPPRSKEY